MSSPEILTNSPEASLIPKEFLGKEFFITSGNGERVIELGCRRIESSRSFLRSIRETFFRPGPTDEARPTAMTLSLFLRWGAGFKNMITASVQENHATRERQLSVSLAATPRHHWINSWDRAQGEVLAVEYTSENDGRLSTRPSGVEFLETLQFLSDRGMLTETQLPPQMDLEATIKGFVEIVQDILKREEAGDLPKEFPMPCLVPGD